MDNKPIIATELLKGQGLGNQLFCYVTTRALAYSKGYDFSILNREIFKERSPHILFKAYFLEESPFKYHHVSLEYLSSMGFDIGEPFYICNNNIVNYGGFI